MDDKSSSNKTNYNPHNMMNIRYTRNLIFKKILKNKGLRFLEPQLIEYMVGKLDGTTIELIIYVIVQVYAGMWSFLITCYCFLSQTTNNCALL